MRRASRLTVWGLLCAALVGAQGCYQYTPVAGPLPVRAPVALALTDHGRAQLSDRIGPEIDELRGLLVSSTDSLVVVAMQESVTLRGISSKWAGEELTVPRGLIARVRQRQFSRARTIGLVATGGLGAAVAIVSVAAAGASTIQIDQPSDPPPGNSSKTASATAATRSPY
jgi:hypothetical protein